MKSKYEISVWTDVYDESIDRFVEQKEIIIGSDTMTSESRAREPKLVNNVNGTNQFTFNLYYRYIDTRTGEEVENPYIPFLVNERKIKVFWKDQWYDMLIKQIKEDQANRYITYICEDGYITELSRTGFELEFATELENNIGTAKDLVNSVIDGTDWQFDENSDTIYQLTEESVYEAVVLNNFMAERCPDGQEVEIIEGHPILIYYSCAHNIDDLKEDCQFYYAGATLEQDQNDMLVINGTCYNITVEWVVSGNQATAMAADVELFTIAFDNGLSTNYRAERYVQSQKTVYNDILERYVSVFQSKTEVDDEGNPKIIYGYESTEYNDALAVVNLVTNSSNFKDVSGWTGDELYFKIYPPFDQYTEISSYTAKSYFRLKGNKSYFNSGIQNNRSYISKGFIVGENYIFRIKAQSDSQLGSDQYIESPSVFSPTIAKRNTSYQIGDPVFEVTDSGFKDGWLEYNMTCIKSCPYETLLTAIESCGIFLIVNTSSSNIYWIEEVQFFREIFGEKDGEIVRINPNEMDTQSIATITWKYFDADQPAGTTKDNLVYVYNCIGQWFDVEPVYNQYERYGTIEADNSNRFNILQSIAETFKCWVQFIIEHDERGYIITDENHIPRKLVHLALQTGEETGIGFIYGVDLKGVTRTLKSNQIATKTIVSQNENEFGENGFCSIARSKQNYSRENVIYNFDYYIQQGLLNGDVVNYDLYNNTSKLKYYPQLHALNTLYAENLERLINKKTELTRQQASQTVYDQYLTAAINEKQEVEQSIMKLAGVETWDDAIIYAESHYNDIKVQSLINDRTQLISTIQMYTGLKTSMDSSVEALQEYVDEKQAIQDGIIADLRALNKAFYSKYSRYIQEGTWSSEDYWNDDLYYLDAVEVAYKGSRPQVQYDINVLRLSELEDYSSKVFKLGDISYIQDVKYFGYQKDGITPYKEKVMLSEITSFFDTPDKDTIKVQNYKTQFDDLFQRITAATQNLEFSEGKYAKAANIVQSDGTIKSSVIQNTFNTNKDLVYGAQNESVNMDNTGITVTDNDNAANLLKITSGGVFVSADAGATWRNAIRGDGINTELLTAGRVNTEEITIYNGEYPSFRWDAMGINAYKFNDNGSVDTTQFVRFDRFGIYGLHGVDPVFIPTSEQQIYNAAKFGLTWNKFFMKSTGNDKFIEISTERDIVISEKNDQNIFVDRIVIGRVDGTDTDSYGMRIRNKDNETIFECGNLWDDVSQTFVETAMIAGWKFNTECLESEATTADNQTIRIYADGNIGCYGNAATTYPENVYIVEPTNNFVGTGLNINDTRTFTSSDVVYVFVTSVGKTKTQKQLSGEYDSDQLDPDKPANWVTPTNPSLIQIAYQSDNTTYNYNVDNITWTYSLNTENSSYQETIVGSGEETTKYTTYIYAFDLTATINNTIIFTIPYQITFSTQKNKYTKASNTKWSIDNNGDAIFHDIYADGGTIAGWFIDNEKIYQTTNGKRDGPIKTQLNSAGTAQSSGFDYSIITDAVNAAMATLGGVLIQNGLINGYNIAQVANTANAAYSMAQSAYSKATALDGHKHSITPQADSTTVGSNNIVYYMAPPNSTGAPISS